MDFDTTVDNSPVLEVIDPNTGIVTDIVAEVHTTAPTTSVSTVPVDVSLTTVVPDDIEYSLEAITVCTDLMYHEDIVAACGNVADSQTDNAFNYCLDRVSLDCFVSSGVYSRIIE